MQGGPCEMPDQGRRTCPVAAVQWENMSEPRLFQTMYSSEHSEKWNCETVPTVERSAVC